MLQLLSGGEGVQNDRIDVVSLHPERVIVVLVQVLQLPGEQMQMVGVQGGSVDIGHRGLPQHHIVVDGACERVSCLLIPSIKLQLLTGEGKGQGRWSGIQTCCS